MADQKQQAVEDKVLNAGEEASVDSPTKGEGVKAPEPKATPESEAEVKETKEAATSAESKTEAEEEGGKKKSTRTERRIRQLIEKLKETGAKAETYGEAQQQPQSEAVSEILGIGTQPPWQKGSSILQPGAEVSVEELQAELNRRAAAIAELKARQVVEQTRQKERFEKAVNEFAGELEKLSREVPELNPDSPEYDKDLDKKFAELIAEVNSDERGRFLPKKKPSELWEVIKVAREKAKTKGQAETTAKMAKSMAEAAVSPTASPKKRLSTEEEIAEALRRGEITAEEAEKLLPKAGYGY